MLSGFLYAGHVRFPTKPIGTIPAGAHLAALNETFAKRLYKCASGTIYQNVALLLSETPVILQALGVEPLPLVIRDKTVEKVLRGKHRLLLSILRSIPAELHDPIAVFDSTTEPGNFVVMTGLKNGRGKTIIVAVHPSREYGRHKLNMVASVYEKERDAWFAKQTEKGALRYVNIKKASVWSVTSGQLFLSRVRGTSQGSGSNILTYDDFVKEKRGVPDTLFHSPQAGEDENTLPGPAPG